MHHPKQIFKRTFIAFSVIPFALVFLYTPYSLIFFGVLFFVCLILAYEIMHFKKDVPLSSKITLYSFTALVFLIKYLHYFHAPALKEYFSITIHLHEWLLILCLLLMIYEVSLYIKNFKENSLHNGGSMTGIMFIFLYIVVMPSYLIDIKYLHLNPHIRSSLDSVIDLHYLGTYYAFFGVVTAWAYDTGAYFVGRAFGRVKLNLAISPNKSWAGIVGGILLSFVSYFLHSFTMRHFHPELMGYSLFGKPLWQGILITLVIALACQYGDIFASALKRQSQVKDSGKIFLIHGGVLDRTDSIIFSIFIMHLLIISSIII